MLCLSGFELYSRWVPLNLTLLIFQWQGKVIKKILKELESV